MKDMNCYNTFIEVSADCPVSTAEAPPSRGETVSIPAMQYEMIAKHPYTYTQEDVLFEIFAKRNHIVDSAKEIERQRFFSKGQPCLRTSALGKRYGWGIHCDKHGKVALYAVESQEYQAFSKDPNLKHVRAMRLHRG